MMSLSQGILVLAAGGVGIVVLAWLVHRFIECIKRPILEKRQPCLGEVQPCQSIEDYRQLAQLAQAPATAKTPASKPPAVASYARPMPSNANLFKN